MSMVTTIRVIAVSFKKCHIWLWPLSAHHLLKQGGPHGWRQMRHRQTRVNLTTLIRQVDVAAWALRWRHGRRRRWPLWGLAQLAAAQGLQSLENQLEVGGLIHVQASKNRATWAMSRS